MQARPGQRDFCGVELLFDPPHEFTAHIPLAQRFGGRAAPNQHPGFAELLDTVNIERLKDVRAKGWIFSHLLVHGAQNRGHLFGVVTIRNSQVENVVRKLFGHVRDDVYLPVADEVNRTVEVPENDHAQADLFDQSSFSFNIHDVAYSDLIFQQNEKSADDILNEILRAET